MGRRWYEEGKLAAKPTTFTDFIACARALIEQGWTSPERSWWPGAGVPEGC